MLFLVLLRSAESYSGTILHPRHYYVESIRILLTLGIRYDQGVISGVLVMNNFVSLLFFLVTYYFDLKVYHRNTDTCII